MYLRNLYRLIQDEETGGNGSSGGGDGAKGDAPNVEQQIADAVKKAVDEATTGLKAKNSELLGKLKDATKQFEGIDPERARALLAKFESDEDADLIAKGKIDEFLSKKYAKRDADWQKKLDDAKNELKIQQEKTAKFLNRVLDDQLQKAFNGKVDPRSMKAALLEAKQIFGLDDEGNAVQLSSDGTVVLGKDGKTPFSPTEWIDSDTTKKESPYLFPASGTGAGTSQPSNGSHTVQGDVDKMTPAQKMAAGRRN